MDEGHEGQAAAKGTPREVATPPAPAGGGGAKQAPERKPGRSRFPTSRLVVAALLGVVSFVSFIYLLFNPDSLRRLRRSAENVGVVITGQPTPTPDPYAEAVKKIEEDRGEATGRQVKVEIPSELKQYSNSRRFLAIQKASANESGIRSPD